jgi:hypothetical protein
VEWTLGFALAEIDFRPHHDKVIIPATEYHSWHYLFCAILKAILAPVLLYVNFFMSNMISFQEHVTYFVAKHGNVFFPFAKNL